MEQTTTETMEMPDRKRRSLVVQVPADDAPEEAMAEYMRETNECWIMVSATELFGFRGLERANGKACNGDEGTPEN